MGSKRYKVFFTNGTHTEFLAWSWVDLLDKIGKKYDLNDVIQMYRI